MSKKNLSCAKDFAERVGEMPRKDWTRLTINLAPELAEKAKSRAGGSFSAYVKRLIEEDLERPTDNAIDARVEEALRRHGLLGVGAKAAKK